MSNSFRIENIREALDARNRPTVTVWNRLEGRPRRQDFDRSLKAEVRDALWMLTRQGQLGEFESDDVASPAFAKILIATTEFSKYQANHHPPQSFETEVPLEAKVEQRPIPFYLGSQKIALDLRLQMGRQWLKMLDKSGLGSLAQQYIQHPRYSIEPIANDASDAQICAHPEVWAQFAAAAGRMMDGARLYLYLKANPSRHAYEGIDNLRSQEEKTIDTLAEKFINWFEQLYYQPTASSDNAWLPQYLEYKFSCSAPGEGEEQVFTADEYYHGHLDWYNLDTDPSKKSLGEVEGAAEAVPAEPEPISFIPTPVVFDGMPNTRWWAFEDRRTNFGDIQPDTTDLAKLLLIEFGLVYANDWFLLPLTFPAGTVTRVKGFAVTNVFGERFWIEHASAAGEAWQHWTMFNLSAKGTDQPSDVSVLLPTVPKIQEGPPMESVNLVRDEVANMVWGIETKIPLPDGTSKPGGEAAIEMHNYLQKLINEGIEGGLIDSTPVEYKANIRYQVMNTVPENWIPFIPVHLEGDNRQTQLQRAAMPRILEGSPDEPEKVRPRSVLMREGRDMHPRQPYFIHEEEVPRAGVLISHSFQRTRWYNGRVVVWLGVRKQTGRGEGSSGLAFDQTVNVEGAS